MKPLFFIFLLFASQFLRGEIQLKTQVSSQHGIINEPIVVQYTIICNGKENLQSITPPSIPRDLPFRVQLRGPQRESSHHTNIINGRTSISSTTSIVYQYHLTPMEEGNFTVPELEFIADGKTYHSVPVELTISKDQNESTRHLRESVLFTQGADTSAILLGKPIKIHWTIGIPINEEMGIEGVDFPVREINQYFTIKDEQIVEQPPFQKNIQGIPYKIHELSLTVVPRSEGKVLLPPATLRLLIPDKNKSSSRRRSTWPFDDDDFFSPFGSRQNYKRLTILTDELRLTVGELPSAGRPADFSGLIGPITIKCAIAPDEVSVGDPITLTITLKGPSLMQDCMLPDLGRQSSLSGKFRVSGDDPGLVNPDGSLTFQRTLRAVTDSISSVPPLDIPYYDAEKSCYATLTTPSLPLTVTAAKIVTMNDATTHSGAQSLQLAQNLQEPTAINAVHQDIAPNASIADVCRIELSPREFPGRKAPFRWCFFLPSCILLLSILARIAWGCLNMTPAQRSAKKARGILFRALEKATDAGQCYDAMQGYCVAALQLPPGAVTAKELRNLKTCKLSPQELSDLADALEKCEMARYAGQCDDLGKLKQSIREAAR